MNLLSRRAVRVGLAAASLCLAWGVAGLAVGQSADNPQAAAPAAGGGRVIAKGPGYSIEAARGTRNAAAAAGQTQVTDAPLETLHEPIVWQGQRVLNIDNRDIRFDGNAITAGMDARSISPTAGSVPAALPSVRTTPACT